MDDQIKLSEDQYLQAFALFTMARQKSGEARQLELGLCKVLGLSPHNDHLSDAIWSYHVADDAFDVALAREGYEVPALSARGEPRPTKTEGEG